MAPSEPRSARCSNERQRSPPGEGEEEEEEEEEEESCYAVCFGARGKLEPSSFILLARWLARAAIAQSVRVTRVQWGTRPPSVRVLRASLAPSIQSLDLSSLRPRRCRS